jgi:glutathione synthase/RimK-type ligase-like ATP-grasp enzyme
VVDPPVVLIFSTSQDLHAQAVCYELNRLALARPYIVDTSSWPGEGSIELRPGGERDLSVLRLPGVEVEIRPPQVAGIWWRRPTGFRSPDGVADPKILEMITQQATHLFRGLLHLLGARLMNVPENDTRAAWKPYQLQVAADVGLFVPRTLMTDNPSSVSAFAEEVGELVYKTFRGPAWRLVPTRRLTHEAMKYLHTVKLAPVIFQERIACAKDLRVTIVGDEVFAAGAPHQSLGDLEDNRVGPRLPLEPYELPGPVLDQLKALMNRLGLVYGAVDMRLTPDNRHVFLEVNPTGQYLWVEIETGLAISDAIARWLATGHAKSNSRS